MSLAKALLAFQAEAPALHKDATNPHFGSRFVSLDSLVAAVRPVLNKHGLAFLQMPTTVDGQPALRTVLLHESGEKLEDVMLLNAAKPDPQGQGSALTYARRYALAATLGLVADEDDDGNATRVGGGTNGVSKVGVPQAEPSAADESASPASQFVAPPPREQPGDGGQPEAIVITFGKHKGKTLAEVDAGYLKWLVEKFEPKTVEQRRIIAGARVMSGLPVPGVLLPSSDDDIPF